MISSPKTSFSAYAGASAIPGDLKLALGRAYVELFAQPPWQEQWKLADVIDKLDRETAGDGLITLVRGNETHPVAGFCWGAVITASQIADRVVRTRAVDRDAVHRIASVSDSDRAIFFDEIGILPQFRNGIAPLLGMLLPFADLGYARGASALCWSSPEARIVPIIVEYFGFRDVGAAGDIHFYFMSAADVAARRAIMRAALESISS